MSKRYVLLLRPPTGEEYRSGPWTAALIREIADYYGRCVPEVELEVSEAEGPPAAGWGPMWST
jgi:hypothetical protein